MYRKVILEILASTAAVTALLIAFTYISNSGKLDKVDDYIPAVLAFLVGMSIKGFLDIRKKTKQSPKE